MKRYWPFMGAVGVAATIGLYVYVSRDPVYEEPETEEFLEEESEHRAEQPDDKIPVPYNSPRPVAKEKKQIKEKPDSQKYNQKEERARKLPSQPSLPKSSDLEKAIEEDEERSSYDLPQEERDKLNSIDLFNDYFGKALHEEDFRVAETYLNDFNKHTDFNPKDDAFCIALIAITLDYNHYLSTVIKNCKTQDYSSVFRKVVWGNLFLSNYENKMNECRVTVDTEQGKRNPSTLIQKGTQALDAIEYCHE